MEKRRLCIVLYLILLQEMLDHIGADGTQNFVLILLYDVLHERDPAHEFGDSVSGGQLLHLQLQDNKSSEYAFNISDKKNIIF